MTTISFFKKNNSIIGFECIGHSDYSSHGKDILCASISTITQTAILGFQKVLKLRGELVRDEKLGYLKYVLPNNLTDGELINAKLLFDTMIVALQDLESEFSKYLKVEV